MDPDRGPEDREPAETGPGETVRDIPETQEIDFVTLGMFIIGVCILSLLSCMV